MSILTLDFCAPATAAKLLTNGSRVDVDSLA